MGLPRLICSHICFPSGLVLMFLTARGKVKEISFTACQYPIPIACERGHLGSIAITFFFKGTEAGARGAELKTLEISEFPFHGGGWEMITVAPCCTRLPALGRLGIDPASSRNQDAKDYSNKRIPNEQPFGTVTTIDKMPGTPAFSSLQLSVSPDRPSWKPATANGRRLSTSHRILSADDHSSGLNWDDSSS